MPIQNPCALLDRLLREGERDWVEFKANNDDPDTIGQYVSSLANAAILADVPRAFLIFGVDDATRAPIGTSVRLQTKKVGNEDFENWLNRMLDPKMMVELLDFTCEGKAFSVLVVEPSYERPVKFKDEAYFRLGKNKKKLSNSPEHERAIWLATGRRKFENAVALPNQTADQVLSKLDHETYFEQSNQPTPKSPAEIVSTFVKQGFVLDNLEGSFDITNLGAILLAKNVEEFPSIAGKSVRIIKYVGKDKSKSEFEQVGRLGYAVGFPGMMRFLSKRLPTEEVYVQGVRRNEPWYPEVAIRETIANALIHQDFTITGTGPVIEIYEDRIEITNPGNSLIDPDRMIDERRSRNEMLASKMRDLGICEERGGGLDKALLEIERRHLPAPEFLSSQDSMRVVLFRSRPFSALYRRERIRACYYHCVIRWLQHDPMSNSSLRERFQLEPSAYKSVSAVIAEAIKLERIAPADPEQGNRNAKYIPYWAS